jgi:hypothetical protein
MPCRKLGRGAGTRDAAGDIDLFVSALFTLWLITRFDLSVGTAARFCFCTGLISADSQLAARPLGRRIGLLNTIVFIACAIEPLSVRGGVRAVKFALQLQRRLKRVAKTDELPLLNPPQKR